MKQVEHDQQLKAAKKKRLMLIVNSTLGVLIIAGTGVYSGLTHQFSWMIQTVVYGLTAACLMCVPVCAAIRKESGIKESIMKLAYVIMICVFVVVPIFMISKSCLHLDSAEDVKNFILGTGGWGMVIYVLLQILNVVVLPLPAFIFYGAGVSLYGAWVTLALSSLGVIAGSVIDFVIGRVFGFRVVAWIAGRDQTVKYSEMFGSRGKVLFIMMQVLPFFPDDILCMVAGLTSMSWVFFLCVMLIVRPLVIAVYCFGFEWIPFDQAWGIAVWAAIVVVCIIAGIFAYKYQDKMEKWFKKKFCGIKPEPEKNEDTVPPVALYTDHADDPATAPDADPAVTADRTPDPSVSVLSGEPPSDARNTFPPDKKD